MFSLATIGLALLGLTVGVLSGLLGIGGGILYVPALVFITGVPIHQAVGISLAIIAPSALAGVFKFHLTQGVDFSSALIVAPLAIIGCILGAHINAFVSASLLKRLFGVLLILVGVNAFLGLGEKIGDSEKPGAKKQTVDQAGASKEGASREDASKEGASREDR